MPPLGEDYFARYGVNERGVEKTGYSRSWRRFTFSLSEILRVHRARLGAAPRTLLDLGAADGRFLREALKRGLDAHGVENSPYILERIRDPDLRARIQRADAAAAVRGFDPGAFDVVVECAAQYLPPRRLPRYLSGLARLRPGLLCLLVDPRGYKGDRNGPHTGVRTFETVTWWRRALRDHGFARVPGHDFYFVSEKRGVREVGGGRTDRPRT